MIKLVEENSYSDKSYIIKKLVDIYSKHLDNFEFIDWLEHCLGDMEEDFEVELEDLVDGDLRIQLENWLGEDFEERLEETIEEFIEERRSGYDGNGSNHHDGVTEHNYDPNHL